LWAEVAGKEARTVNNPLTFLVYLKWILKSQFCCPSICGRKCWEKMALVTESFDFSCIFEADSKKPIMLPFHLQAEVLGKMALVTESFHFSCIFEADSQKPILLPPSMCGRKWREKKYVR